MTSIENQKVLEQYLFTDLAIKNMEIDIQRIEKGTFKIKEPYIEMIEKMISNVVKERRKLKQMMYKNKLKLEFLYEKEHFVTYEFYMNRRMKEMTYNKAVFKKHVANIIKKHSLN